MEKNKKSVLRVSNRDPFFKNSNKPLKTNFFFRKTIEKSETSQIHKVEEDFSENNFLKPEKNNKSESLKFKIDKKPKECQKQSEFHVLTSRLIKGFLSQNQNSEISIPQTDQKSQIKCMKKTNVCLNDKKLNILQFLSRFDNKMSQNVCEDSSKIEAFNSIHSKLNNNLFSQKKNFRVSKFFQTFSEPFTNHLNNFPRLLKSKINSFQNQTESGKKDFEKLKLGRFDDIIARRIQAYENVEKNIENIDKFHSWQVQWLGKKLSNTVQLKQDNLLNESLNNKQKTIVQSLISKTGINEIDEIENELFSLSKQPLVFESIDKGQKVEDSDYKI